jgi:hypothetical protein
MSDQQIYPVWDVEWLSTKGWKVAIRQSTREEAEKIMRIEQKYFPKLKYRVVPYMPDEQ